MPFLGKAQWVRGIVDMDKTAQVGRCCCLDHSVAECRSFKFNVGFMPAEYMLVIPNMIAFKLHLQRK